MRKTPVRVRDWLVSSDPGLLRLEQASRTVVTLALTLVTLFALTTATGQPLTVALLGVVVATQAAMVVKDPDPRQRKVTLLVLPIPAIAVVGAAAMLVPYKVAGDLVFVAIVFIAVYIRRFGNRGTAVGMVTFMAYFFALYLGATIAELPRLIAGIVIGALCSFIVCVHVLPDDPERALRRSVWSLWTRIAAVMEISCQSLRKGRLDRRLRNRLQSKIVQLNETFVMVQTQTDDNAGAGTLWPGITNDELVARLFNAELSAERLAIRCARVADNAAAVPTETRLRMADALAQLAVASRRASAEESDRAVRQARETVANEPAIPEIRQAALAVIAMGSAISEMRVLIRSVNTTSPVSEAVSPVLYEDDTHRGDQDDHDTEDGDTGDDGLPPTTRQAIQATTAASLAIWAGGLVSPAHWYWAVVTSFVVFTGTISRGDILTRGWQRFLGTALGVPLGVLLATALSGQTAVAVGLIVVCLSLAFYFAKAAPSLMIFCITSVLALLYGLMGHFSVNVLLLRVEETAVGAVAGIAAATLVLPTKTSDSVKRNLNTFYVNLSELIDISIKEALDSQASTHATEKALQVHRQLQEVRVSARPLTSGIASLGATGDVHHQLRLITICNYHARILARSTERLHHSPSWTELTEHLRAIGETIRHNINALSDQDLSGQHFARAATDLLDSAEGLTLTHHDPSYHLSAVSKLQLALHSLRAIDTAVIDMTRRAGITCGRDIH